MFYFERQMFKPVSGGYIFQPLPPTRFHHTQAYVVTDAQKEKIEIVTRRGTALVRTLTFAAMALAVFMGILIDRYGAPWLLTAFLGFCTWIIAQMLGTAAVLHLKLRQLQPLLADLPRSDERLFPKLNPTPSPRYIAIWCALFGFLLGQRFEQHPPFTDLLSTVFLAALAINLILALRTAPAAGVSQVQRFN